MIVLLTRSRRWPLSVAAALTPLGMFYVAGNAPIAWAMVPIALILVWRHKANIQSLLAGRERTIGR